MLKAFIRKPSTFVYKPCKMDEFPGLWRLVEIPGEPIGYVISDSRGMVGWSLCNPKDKFNKKRGTEIAKMRLDLYKTLDCDLEDILLTTPEEIRRDVEYMYDRSRRYYKE